MSDLFNFKQTTQPKLVYTEKGEFGKPFISIIIASGDDGITDDVKWSFPLNEIVKNYDGMKTYFTSWFFGGAEDHLYYLDDAHKEYILRDLDSYYDSDYLWNRLFVEDEVIRDIIANHEIKTVEIMNAGDILEDSSITRTKSVIFRIINDAGYFLMQHHAHRYVPYDYSIHTLGDAGFGSDVSTEFFKWFNHLRDKVWFTMEHLNDFISVVKRNWKLPFTEIR